MAIEFFTGFEGCGSTEDCLQLINARIYNGLTNFTYHSTGGYDNGKCIGAPSTSWVNRKGLWKNISPSKTKVMGFHVRGMITESTITQGGEIFFRFKLDDDTWLILQNHSTGLAAYNASTLLADCETVVSSSFQHIELKVYSHASQGTFQVKLNGTLVLDASSLDTNGADIVQFEIGSMTEDSRFDNIFVADDWVGELRSVLLSPTSDDSVQFTPSAGSDNYAMVDDAAQDGDTTYVESATNGHKDLYGVTDIAVGLVPHVLTAMVIAKKTDVGLTSLKLQAKQGSTLYDLETGTLATDYPSAALEGILHTLDVCPDGTTPLSRTEVNDLKFGFEAVI